MMKLVKTTSLLVGVFFASTFTFVNAQQYNQNTGTQNANIVLQIQTLQAEIADLRDMIERQNYQIRLLKKQLNSNSNVTGSVIPTPAVNPVVDSVANAVQTPSIDVDSQQSEAINSVVGGGSVIANSSATNVSNDNIVSAGISADNSVVVEERSLDLRETVYSANDFPPVSEVRVGDSQVGEATGADNVGTTDAQPPELVIENIPPLTTGEQTVEQSFPQSTQEVSVPTTQATITEPNAPIVPLPSPVDVGDTQVIQQQVLQEEVLQEEVLQEAEQETQAVTEQANNTLNAIQPVETTLPASGQSSQTVQATPEQAVAAAPSLPTAEVPIAPVVPTVQETVQEIILPEPDYYQQGFELLKQSNHSDAVDVFQKQVTAYPSGDLADDAYYWIAESMYVNRRLNVSKENFNVIIERYKSSPRLPDAMLKMAYIEQEQGNSIEARLLLQEIIQLHPSSNAAISAKNRLEQLN